MFITLAGQASASGLDVGAVVGIPRHCVSFSCMKAVRRRSRTDCQTQHDRQGQAAVRSCLRAGEGKVGRSLRPAYNGDKGLAKVQGPKKTT